MYFTILDIKCKLWLMPHENKLILFQIIHKIVNSVIPVCCNIHYYYYINYDNFTIYCFFPF